MTTLRDRIQAGMNVHDGLKLHEKGSIFLNETFGSSFRALPKRVRPFESGDLFILLRDNATPRNRLMAWDVGNSTVKMQIPINKNLFEMQIIKPA